MSSNEPREGTTPPPSRLSPSAPAPETPATGPKETPPPAAKSAEPKPSTPPASPGSAAPHDPLRGSRTSGFWATVVFLVIVLILLAIFVLQNTQRVEVRFLGWSGNPPLAAAMLIAVAAALLLAVAAGTLRILQLRRRVKRERKAERPAKAKKTKK